MNVVCKTGLIVLLLLSGGVCRAQEEVITTGCLVFVTDTIGMGNAIAQSTGQYTHVAIIEVKGEQINVFEAIPGRGVVCRSFSHFLSDLEQDHPGQELKNYVKILCPNVLFCGDSVVARARRFLGQPYDDYFLPDNGRMYCSELVYECFLDSVGEHVFCQRPMNFKNQDGKVPLYWQQHFQRLGVEIPQGLPGTNPSDMAREKFMKPLQCVR